jgi:hypothetical protein
MERSSSDVSRQRTRGPRDVKTVIERLAYTGSTKIVFILENSLLLVGTAVAVLWANLDFDSYDGVAHPLHFWVNEIGMVFFLAAPPKKFSRRHSPADPWRRRDRRSRRSRLRSAEWSDRH